MAEMSPEVLAVFEEPEPDVQALLLKVMFWEELVKEPPPVTFDFLNPEHIKAMDLFRRTGAYYLYRLSENSPSDEAILYAIAAPAYGIRIKMIAIIRNDRVKDPTVTMLLNPGYEGEGKPELTPEICQMHHAEVWEVPRFSKFHLWATTPSEQNYYQVIEHTPIPGRVFGSRYIQQAIDALNQKYPVDYLSPLGRNMYKRKLASAAKKDRRVREQLNVLGVCTICTQPFGEHSPGCPGSNH